MSFWRKFKNKLIEWLSEKKPESAIEPEPQMYDPGLDCPQCNYRIKISMEMLLGGDAIICPRCNLNLHVNQQESKSCLNEVKKVHEAIQAAEAAKEIG